MKKAMGILLGLMCVAFLVSLLVTPQPRIQHRGSSAFDVALERAVDRLEGTGRFVLAGTATPVDAQLQPTFDGRYTCDTYEAAMTTCDPAQPGCLTHTADPMGHTCVAGEYTCQVATCDTYDRQQYTCDPANADCPTATHTSEPSPYNHTCEGHTCDGAFTCDFTVDPRAWTCDAADVDCQDVTFNAFISTCDPMKPECRESNPDHCTAEGYFTCIVTEVTCDPLDPNCPTIDPRPGCATATEHTTWGQLKTLHMRE
ncbi:MAG: hypothetical protein JSW03_09740 [Candidatus Eiseniibacteriota bacterium]|nr:MAG: hypothetical protein JSW03_09740 [Candidatus Eisenbacteria bacterium]